MNEFQASTSQWQHMNDRADKEIQYYLSLVGLVGTAVGLLFQLGTSVVAALGVFHFFTFVIGVAGVRLLRRIIHLTGQSALFSAQIGMVRRCFVNLDEPLESYVILTTASTDETAHHFTPISKQLSVRLLTVINSFLAAVVVFITPIYFYWYLQDVFLPTVWIVVFVVVGIISIAICVAFLQRQRAMSISRGDKYLSKITDIVQQKLQERLSELIEYE